VVASGLPNVASGRSSVGENPESVLRRAMTSTAVMFRASHHSDHLEVELARRNIPFVKYGGLKFLEAAHDKDALSFLRLAENPRDTTSAYRVLQLLDGFGPTQIHSLSVLPAPTTRTGCVQVSPPSVDLATETFVPPPLLR